MESIRFTQNNVINKEEKMTACLTCIVLLYYFRVCVSLDVF